jgi:hypothetical protein
MQLTLQKTATLLFKNNTLTKNIEINASQSSVRYQQDDGTIRDRLTFIPDDSIGVSWTPGTIANGASAFTTVTVTDVVLGWIAVASFSLSIANMSISAQVTGASTVTVVITNNTGSSVTLGAGVLRVLVIPYN